MCNGDLLMATLFSENKFQMFIEIHKGAVLSLWTVPDVNKTGSDREDK